MLPALFAFATLGGGRNAFAFQIAPYEKPGNPFPLFTMRMKNIAPEHFRGGGAALVHQQRFIVRRDSDDKMFADPVPADNWRRLDSVNWNPYVDLKPGDAFNFGMRDLVTHFSLPPGSYRLWAYAYASVLDQPLKSNVLSFVVRKYDSHWRPTWP